MERKGYNIWDLEIITIEETRRFDNLQDESSEEVIKFIKDTILNERLELLEAYFGEGDAYYISVYAEKSCSAIKIHDDPNRKSYNYINKKYENDETDVPLSGYYFPQEIICEDKDILLDIIRYYFETGNINEAYDWIEFDD
ncbi:MAG: hypothetical protein K2K74_06275 [Lachnospiraceae bacterium]|nr:hypothetical protein [Lachnospiraceae bacterium]